MYISEFRGPGLYTPPREIPIEGEPIDLSLQPASLPFSGVGGEPFGWPSDPVDSIEGIEFNSLDSVDGRQAPAASQSPISIAGEAAAASSQARPFDIQDSWVGTPFSEMEPASEMEALDGGENPR